MIKESLFGPLFGVLTALTALHGFQSLKERIWILIHRIILFEYSLLPLINTIHNSFILLFLLELDFDVPVWFGEHRLKFFVINCKLLFIGVIGDG
jgi:hypothetical protein